MFENFYFSWKRRTNLWRRSLNACVFWFLFCVLLYTIISHLSIFFYNGKYPKKGSNESHSQDNDSINYEKPLNYIQTISQMKLNLDTFQLFLNDKATSNLSENVYKKYINDWYNLMYAFIENLSFQNRQDRSRKQLELKQLIFNAIDNLQNPPNCRTAKKLICSYEDCGYACQLHNFAYCFIASLALKRTVTFVAINQFKQLFKGFDSACSPPSQEEYEYLTYIAKFNGKSKFWTHIRSLNGSAKFRPLAIPQNLQVKLEQLTRVPFILFVGHILSYIMRLKNPYQDLFMEHRKKMNLDNIGKGNDMIVGVHVRRTDKLRSEGTYHALSEYMEIVERIYDRVDVHDQLMGKQEKRKRKVYLATDDVNVWNDEVPNYVAQGYQFLGEKSFSQYADPKRRLHFVSFQQAIFDILSLSLSDYLVCTLGSGLCRCAYELMQVQRQDGRDMSSNVYSLDDVYFYSGQLSHRLEAIMDNNYSYISADEHVFKVGDTLGIAGAQFNGYFLGDLQTKNGSIKEIKKYPGFKVIERVDTALFDAFDHLNI